MVIGTLGSALVWRKSAPGDDQRLQARLALLKARVAGAIRAAERGVGGKAVSIHLDEGSSKPQWVIVVDTDGKRVDVVVDDAGAIVRTAPHVDPPRAMLQGADKSPSPVRDGAKP